MGLNRLMSLSKNSVRPDAKPINVKGSKIAVKKIENCENRKEKCVAQEKDLSGDVSSQKIDKTSKNLKIATTAKKSMIWNTLRITNKNKSAVMKGKLREIPGNYIKLLRLWGEVWIAFPASEAAGAPSCLKKIDVDVETKRKIGQPLSSIDCNCDC